jgi:hypothetical protein
MKEWIEKAEGGQVANLDLPELTDSPFRVFVAKVLKGLPGEATQRWSKLLDDEPAGWCATLRLRGTLEAALLHRWHTGHKPTNPRKFHSQYGMSRQGDIDHLAAYVPYVDAFMTDDSTFALCGDELVAQELRHYPAKLVARRNYAEFDAWLDELLGQPPPVLFNSA